MTKKQLFAILASVPDDAFIRTSDDLNIIAVDVEKHQLGVTELTIVYLLDDGAADEIALGEHCIQCGAQLGTCGNCGQLVCFECHDRDTCHMGGA